MNELSLFSGAGGGLLASKYLLGWRTLGYVEWEDYPQRVLAQRIKDGLLDEAPIYGDIRTFISKGYAEQYRGMVDVVSGGFPCQPFSVAGKQAGEDDPRNMWPSTCEVIRITKPSCAFLENVPNIVSCGYIGNVLKDLSKIGYNARWVTLGGGNTGSCSNGQRLWILAFKADGSMLEGMEFSKHLKSCSEESFRRQFTRAVSKMLSQDDYSRIERSSDALAQGMDRLKAIGNGQDPFVAATAWNFLSKGLNVESPTSTR